MYVRQIRGARQRILIANSYFVPDNTVRRALERAARRGVEVRVIVPKKSDVPSVGWAARALFASLMRAGVHVHFWIEGMMHAKSAVIDHWATVGSYNLDYRSLRYNLEVNVASEEPGFVESVEQSIRTDLEESCQEIDRLEWARRPWLEKVFEWFAYLVRKVL
jgi:cardiolipin synthase